MESRSSGLPCFHTRGRQGQRLLQANKALAVQELTLIQKRAFKYLLARNDMNTDSALR